MNLYTRFKTLFYLIRLEVATMLENYHVKPSGTVRRNSAMKLLKRIMFAIKFDIAPDYIVYSIPDQMATIFTDYEDAEKYSKSQPEYNPKVLVEVKKV